MFAYTQVELWLFSVPQQVAHAFVVYFKITARYKSTMPIPLRPLVDFHKRVLRVTFMFDIHFNNNDNDNKIHKAPQTR